MSAFWDWAVAAYRDEAVRIACLDLQDAQGQNVPLLLWAAWCAASGRAPDEEALEAAVDTARNWQDHAIAPLRALRRTLKPRIPDMDDADRETVRDQVKALELDAERRLMSALEGLAPAPSSDARDLFPALVAVSRVWSPTTPRTALMLLAQRLSA